MILTSTGYVSISADELVAALGLDPELVRLTGIESFPVTYAGDTPKIVTLHLMWKARHEYTLSLATPPRREVGEP